MVEIFDEYTKKIDEGYKIDDERINVFVGFLHYIEMSYFRP